MGDRFLLNLADVCRRVGAVVEVDGWQSRGRSSGGYADGKPDHVAVHHTASGPSSDGWPDVEYMTYHADAAPICNLYIARNGTIYVCAAGATNTNGSGVDPCGHIPDDTLNTSAIGIEAGNDGVGEVWPDIQLDTYVDLVEELTAVYGIPVDRVHGHAEYAPSRKVDPAGPPRYATGAATWNMDAFRDDVTWQQPQPTPTPGGDDVTVKLVLEDVRPPHARWLCDGNTKTWIRDGDASQQIDLRLEESAAGLPSPIDGFVYRLLRHGGDDVIASYGPVVGPRPDGFDEYGRMT